jgi:hypothetical protein
MPAHRYFVCGVDDCLRHSNRLKRFCYGREDAGVMWSALRLVENQFAEAGFTPR